MTEKTSWQAIPHTRGLPIPLTPVVHRTVERRNTSPFQQPARLDDAARFRAEQDAARELADLDRRKRAARPSARKRSKSAPAKWVGEPREWDLDEVIRRYCEGESSMKLGPEFGVTHTTILKRLRRAGVAIGPSASDLSRARRDA